MPWTSDESYEWLPGGFFVLYPAGRNGQERKFKGAEIMGYDEAEVGYFTRFFDTAGNHPDYRAQVKGTSGPSPSRRPAQRSRSAMTATA
jgi:hypothetical protein